MNIDERAITEAHKLGVWVGNRWNILWRAQQIAARKREIAEWLARSREPEQLTFDF